MGLDDSLSGPSYLMERQGRWKVATFLYVGKEAWTANGKGGMVICSSSFSVRWRTMKYFRGNLSVVQRQQPNLNGSLRQHGSSNPARNIIGWAHMIRNIIHAPTNIARDDKDAQILQYIGE
jgi:hypothetical protein